MRATQRRPFPNLAFAVVLLLCTSAMSKAPGTSTSAAPSLDNVAALAPPFTCLGCAVFGPVPGEPGWYYLNWGTTCDPSIPGNNCADCLEPLATCHTSGLKWDGPCDVSCCAEGGSFCAEPLAVDVADYTALRLALAKYPTLIKYNADRRSIQVFSGCGSVLRSTPISADALGKILAP
jgi:hypothetical protein